MRRWSTGVSSPCPSSMRAPSQLPTARLKSDLRALIDVLAACSARSCWRAPASRLTAPSFEKLITGCSPGDYLDRSNSLLAWFLPCLSLTDTWEMPGLGSPRLGLLLGGVRSWKAPLQEGDRGEADPQSDQAMRGGVG